MKSNVATDANRHRLADINVAPPGTLPAGLLSPCLARGAVSSASTQAIPLHTTTHLYASLFLYTHHVVIPPFCQTFISFAAPPEKPQIGKKSENEVVGSDIVSLTAGG